MASKDSNQLLLKDKIVYGMAGIGDGTTYCFLATFLMFFLTSVVGIAPASAGFIVAVGTVCDVLAGPFVGFFSDNCTSRFGRRRPFIFCGAIPLMITTAMLFTFVDLSPNMKVAYYCLMVILFWSSFSCFFVPYTALGSEMTTDYDERISLRSFTTICNNIGNVAGTVMPSFIVGILMDGGQSQSAAWSITAMGVGIFAGAAVIATAVGTGGRDTPACGKDKIEKFNLKKMLTEYLEIMKLKPMQILVVTSIIALTGLTLATADRMYFFTYNCGFSSEVISMVLLIGCIAGFIGPVIIGFATKFMDKRRAYIVIMTAFALLMVSFRILGMSSLLQMIIVSIILGAGYMCYWQLMPTLLYDICECDLLVNGKRRSGQIMSLQGIAEGVAEAMGSQLLGIILQIFGFESDGASQPASAEAAMENCMFILPALFAIVSCLLMWKYPITKEKFNEIKNSLKKTEDRI